MPDTAPSGRKADAVLCPRDYPVPATKGRAAVPAKQDRDVLRNQIFGPLLGSPRVTSVARIDVPGETESFITPCHARLTPDGLVLPDDHVHQTLFFRKGHPMQGDDRYDWFVGIPTKAGSFVPGLPCTGHAGEAGRVKLGYLREDPYAADPAVAAAIQSEYEAMLAAHVLTPEYRAEMKRRGIVLDSDPDRAAVAAELSANPPEATGTKLGAA